ncbi:MAG TPA: hypothetical protein PLE33_07755 [Candidatus Cloacimonas sp.]|jgi:hypothetical protein|nr:hypothetical protein [Candidatus Cloacimonas sp.]HNX03054.1 hypothetical protein [Candidatus Cloacimonas sp.]HPS61139.1 hypothetical protein [Candidatus Cloacimonas sp.]
MKQKDPGDFNSLCVSCYRDCKQKAFTLIIACPYYDPYPVQLELKFKGLRKKLKNK